MSDHHSDEAARILSEASALLVTAGAGMGVDSGLPDFRGPEGFWKAYPAYRHLDLSFSDLANPKWFESDPAFAWGFYGHRLGLYRRTVPHAGFGILAGWAQDRPHFVFTSNVDGQFQRAGFAESVVHEVHGSILWLQCSVPCSSAVWAAEEEVEVDPTSFRAEGDLPMCPHCGAVARPNILMFGDWNFLESREQEQAARLGAFLESLDDIRHLAIVELGAGTAIPTVRRLGERLGARGAQLIRINPREPDGQRAVGLAMGARAALEAIARCLEE